MSDRGENRSQFVPIPQTFIRKHSYCGNTENPNWSGMCALLFDAHKSIWRETKFFIYWKQWTPKQHVTKCMRPKCQFISRERGWSSICRFWAEWPWLKDSSNHSECFFLCILKDNSIYALGHLVGFCENLDKTPAQLTVPLIAVLCEEWNNP